MKSSDYVWHPTCTAVVTRSLARGGVFMSFALYILGFIVLIVGLAWGAHLAHVPQQWIGVGVVVLIGLGVVKAVTHTRQRDSNKLPLGANCAASTKAGR